MAAKAEDMTRMFRSLHLLGAVAAITLAVTGQVLAQGTPAEVRKRARPQPGRTPTMEDAFIAIVEAGRPQSDANFSEHKPAFDLKYRNMAPETIRKARPIFPVPLPARPEKRG